MRPSCNPDSKRAYKRANDVASLPGRILSHAAIATEVASLPGRLSRSARAMLCIARNDVGHDKTYNHLVRAGGQAIPIFTGIA
jgi:predicted fused transcriptional regulator/phosphomethylpyrimidine kinase